MASSTLAKAEEIAYLKHGAVVYRFRRATDPRAFWLNGHVLVLYSRSMSWAGSKPGKIRVAVRNMSAPDKEVILTVPRGTSPFAKVLDWEKNWTPFPHNGHVLLSYRLAPHVVVRCNWSNGECVPLHSSHSPAVWAHHNTTARLGARGSSPAVWLFNTHSYIGIAHFRNADRSYDLCFYHFNATPPFAMLGTSARFSFAAEPNTKPDKIQFVAGMYKHADRLVISYGVDDSYSREISVPISTALRLVQNGPAMQSGLLSSPVYD